MILNNKILIYTIFFFFFFFFLQCAYKMCVHVRHYYISFLLMQSRGSLYILNEALYIFIDAIGLCAFTPCLAAFISSWVALASYKDSLFTRIHAHTPQTHYARQTTRFAQPDRSINHRQNHDERLVIEIITRLQR